jgi:hypothetical protein
MSNVASGLFGLDIEESRIDHGSSKHPDAGSYRQSMKALKNILRRKDSLTLCDTYPLRWTLWRVSVGLRHSQLPTGANSSNRTIKGFRRTLQDPV